MNTSRPLLITLAALLASAALSQAQASQDHPRLTPAAVQVAVASAAETSEGEVRRIDPDRKTITLKHGPLKNLDMPAMTMSFQVSDPALLGKVKVGDKVRFVAANPGGRLTVTEIQVAK